jgi:hypothetical protein
MKVKARGALFRCGRCGKSYSNPFGHECVTRLDRRAPAGKTGLAPKFGLSATCGGCGRAMGNPLTHTCATRTDFKRRAANARKAARKARPEHPRPSACQDRDCKRATCAAYREGRQDGHQDGYDEGFPDGMAACARTHQ